MTSRLERLRERTNDYTVTPRQYMYVAYVAVGALTLIILTGAAVRLTGSGLGCPTWPKCYGNVYPPLNTHAVIEFSNRLITVPVSIAAGAAWLLALRRRPYRRDLMWLGALLPLGVIGQAVLGGFTVKGALDYGWVMGHFALSMLILLAAALLAWRAGHESAVSEVAAEEVAAHAAPAGASNGAGPASGSLAAPAPDRTLIRAARGLVALGALTIFAGTAATAAGPHAGGSPGQKINRLDFDGRGTMDFVIHRHAEIALIFSLASVALWWFARRRQAPALVRSSLTVLCVLLALQGVVGLDQYETHLPTELVWVHVGLACGAWLAALWAACAAGALAPRRVRSGPDRVASAPQGGVGAPLRAGRPLKFPGN
jgi:cytochrome c oxidase assembly protein subunit 15